MDPVTALVLALIGIPVLSFMVVLALTALAVQVAVAGSVIGYLLGIPWALLRRLRPGAAGPAPSTDYWDARLAEAEGLATYRRLRA